MDLVEKTLESCKQAIADAGKTREQIDEIILVVVRPECRLCSRRSDSSSAKNRVRASILMKYRHRRAIQAGVLKGEVKEVLLLDFTPLTLGLRHLVV